MVRRVSLITAMALAVVGCIFALTAVRSYAAQDLAFEKMYYDCDYDLDYEDNCVIIKVKDGCTETVSTVTADDYDTAYAEVSYSGDYIYVYPIGTGVASFTVRGTEGSVIEELEVYVSGAALKGILSRTCSADYLFYGHSKLVIYGLVGSKVSVKIGKDKYKSVKIPVKDNRTYAKTYVKAKRMYNKGTKIYLTFTKDNQKYTKTYKVKANSSLERVKAKGKTVKVTVLDVHKGDKVKLTIGKKTYTKKVKKNYTNKMHTYKFTTRKKVKSNAKFKVVIKNKYKKTLCTYSHRLYKSLWEPMDMWDGDE